MKAILVIDMPNEYAERYNVNEMYVWSLTVQDKHGYQMFDLTTDKPSHLKPMPEKKDIKSILQYRGLAEEYRKEGWNACIDEILGETE